MSRQFTWYNRANSRAKDHRNCTPAVIERFFDRSSLRSSYRGLERPVDKSSLPLFRGKKRRRLFGGGKSLPLATKSTLPTLECASSVSPLVKNGRKLFSVAFSARGRTLCARRRSPAAVGNSIQVAGRVAPLRIPMETKNSQQLRIISKRVPSYRFFPLASSRISAYRREINRSFSHNWLSRNGACSFLSIVPRPVSGNLCLSNP